MTSPRVIVAGATTAITRRTTLRKAFLGPWDPLVQQCWLYALADAQRHTGVAIHHGVLIVNHEHLTVTPSQDSLPEFVHRLHRDVSCAINTLLIAQRSVLDDPPVRGSCAARAQRSHASCARGARGDEASPLERTKELA